MLCWTKSFLLKLFPQSVSETILVYFIYFQELCFLCLKLNQRQMCQVFLRGSALGREQKENLCVLNGCKREGLCWGHIHKVWKEGSLECYQPPTLLLLSPDAKGSWLPLICALQWCQKLQLVSLSQTPTPSAPLFAKVITSLENASLLPVNANCSGTFCREYVLSLLFLMFLLACGHVRL